MVDDSRPFPNLSNILHRLGHELHSDLTEDIWRRDAARSFEKSLQVPINRAQIEKAAIGVAKFPLYSKLGPHCGDCALLTAKKPIQQRLHGPKYVKRRISEVQIDKTHSTITITGKQQRYHPGRRQQQQQPKLKKISKMCDSSTQTDDLIGMKENEEVVASKQIDESFTITETVSDSFLGKRERKLDGKWTWKEQNSKKKIPQKVIELALPPPLKEIPKPKLRTRTCSIPAPEDAMALSTLNHQLYAPIELHCATEAAVKAVDRSVNALEKLILLAPKNSIEKSLLKTISLMCVFLRQFHTELRTKKDRRSKLEMILRLWNELQKQATSQGNPIPMPSEIIRQQQNPTTSLAAPPPSIDGEVLTVKPTIISPCGSSTIDTFGGKMK